MTLAELLDKLGYAESENYLSRDKGNLDSVVDYAHLFRRAAKAPCHLQGVYALRESKNVSIPLIYVCEAGSEAEAKEVHRLVWNQNIVPFLIVNSPESIRLYPGFSYKSGAQGALKVVADFNDASALAEIVDSFRAEAIDSGLTWQKWGKEVTPEHRVDWQLLGNLKKLDRWLQNDGGLDRSVSHSLIGKYVYLHYLRDRKILSLQKLESWGIPRTEIFGRDASVDGVKAVVKELDDWLNGCVFPIDFEKKDAPKSEHLQRVAATFDGDQPRDDGSWQLHLDFKAYDFSYIPIETLSIVYEQFLHTPDSKVGAIRGRSAGAYYTPIPVVNFMLSEIEEHRPLQRGMRICDFSCGSGAFLVQAYRRLIEKEYPPSGPRPSPVDLRELLEDHFFGLDTDPDACSVTELSLILTLLDYVQPPDLSNRGPGRPPHLPKLRNKNIFCDNFFHEETAWQRRFAQKKCDWIVGNPPWKLLKTNNLVESDYVVLDWIMANKLDRPVGNRQMARAFAWRVADFLADDGEIALFLPAMTLFEKAAKHFRAKFFRQMRVHSIANFSNLRWVISAGRFVAPAATFFYRQRAPGEEPVEDEAIRTYSPLIANQEATRPINEGKRNESWSVVVNASEIKDIPLLGILDGDSLGWKLAMWGSHLDQRLLGSLERRFDSIADIKEKGQLIVSEGLQLRCKGDEEKVEPVLEVVGKQKLDMSCLERLRDFFVFPVVAITPVEPELDHARKGRVELPLSICRPPHVIVSAARNFAIYTDDFLVVPPRQIGIISPANDKDFLKAISLFLSSDFALYHQLLTSTEFGIERPRATSRALLQMPMPLADFGRDKLKVWADLHSKLVRRTREVFHARKKANTPLYGEGPTGMKIFPDLLHELNLLVYDSLGLDEQERALIHDLIHVRLELNNGKLGEPAVRRPNPKDLRIYGNCLRSELDSFVEGDLPKRHQVDIIYDDASGMVCVDLIGDAKARPRVSVLRADAPTSAALEKCRARLRQKRSQWVYFDRNFRAYEKTRTYVLKPMQRFHWTVTQARLDAREIIAESMERGNQA